MTGQFTRPAGAPRAHLYNLADFMFGLRNTYALSNILVANLRQNMHFLYLQDDVRVNERLTLNLGVRYEYATPWVEKDNILSNFDPATRQMVLARDGSLEDRATIKPDRNNVGPRLGFAYTLDHATVLRGGYGISYVHFHRAGGANVLPINGPQVINAVVVQSNPLDPSFRRTEQGYDRGPDRSITVQSAGGEHHLHAARTTTRARCRAGSCRCSASLARRMIVDVAYVGNRADDLLLFANFNQAAPNNAAGTIPLQARRPIPEFADITYSFNGGKSRYHAMQAKLDWRVAQRVLAPELADAVADEGQRCRLARESERQLPGAAGLQQSGCRLRFVGLSPAVQQHDQPDLDDAVSERVLGGWQIAAINSVYSGEPVTFIYTPLPAFQVSAIAAGLPRRQQLPPNVTGDPYAPEGERTVQNWFNRNNVVVPTDPSQPFGNAARNSVRGPIVLADRSGVVAADSDAVAGGAVEFRAEFFNLFNRTNFRAPERQPQRRGIRDDHVDLRSAAGATRGEGQLLVRHEVVIGDAHDGRTEAGDMFSIALRRAEAEFLEMPGLKLTVAQAAQALAFRFGTVHGGAVEAGGAAIPR